MVSVRLLSLLSAGAVFAGVTAEVRAQLVGTVNPWDFNVFARSTIGSVSSPYGSDFQGAAGAIGDASFSGFSLRDVAGSSSSLSRSFYGGGDLRMLSGSINNGGAEVRGSVKVSSFSINGPVNAGGNLISIAGGGGTINGNVSLGGTKNAAGGLTINGALAEHQAFGPTVDLGAVGSYFAGTSSQLAARPNSISYTNTYGQLTFNLVSGLNIVTVSSSELLSAWGARVSGPAGSALVINVTGTAATLDSTVFEYTGGASAARTLLNFNQATSLNLSGGNTVGILAPFSAVNFSSGVVTGNLIVDSLSGGGQVNWGGSDASSIYTIIPGPGAAVLIVLGGATLAYRRNRDRMARA